MSNKNSFNGRFLSQALADYFSKPARFCLNPGGFYNKISMGERMRLSLCKTKLITLLLICLYMLMLAAFLLAQAVFPIAALFLMAAAFALFSPLPERAAYSLTVLSARLLC